MNENPIPQSAVSIYGQQDALDDFPVLKAFQQYIDAEQTKSRKRMVVLCAFFAFLMSLVIVVFSVILHRVSDRNQQLNDRLLDYVMQGRAPQPTTIVQSPAAPQNDLALKAMADTLMALQKQIAEQEAKQIKPQAEEKPAVPADAGPSPEQLAMQKKLEEETAKLKQAAELLKAEKEKLSAEKEKIRQREIEMHRRKLYPEHYGEKAPVKKEAENKAARPVISAAPVKTAARPANAAGAIDYFSAYADEEEEESKGELTDEELDDLIDALPRRKSAPTAVEALAPPKKSHAPAEQKNKDAFSISVDESAGDWLVPMK